MSLQFILGNSGSGKSYYLYQKIVEESRNHPDQNYMIIVPEQFTMQTQKDLVMMHPDRGIMNIDILSFRRLAHRIFEEVGEDRRSILTETGKNLMLRKVAIMQKDNLKILGSKMNRPGYVAEVKSMLSELMQYEITDFELKEMLQTAASRPLLHAKLEDIRLLYREFLAYQRDRFMKPEELMDILAQAAHESRLLQNSVLAFDGFTGFTPSQLNVLEQLFRVSKKTMITVTIDARENVAGRIEDHELFALSKKTIRTVTEVAKRAETELEEPVRLGRQLRLRFEKQKELDHLEQNLFRRFRAIYKEETGAISLHQSSTPAMEVHFAARTISRLVREQGYRYQDIAVITGSMSSYHNYVKKIFPMYQVPAFLDETRHILLNPCLEFVRGSLAVIQKDFTAESVFRWLRTGMAGLEAEEIDLLENYVLASGIRGRKRWMQEWDYIPRYLAPEKMELINHYRQRVMERMQPFTEQLSGKNLTLVTCASALCDLLEACEVQQHLKNRELELNQNGQREEGREYSQIYGILIRLLEEMVDLMGEENVTVQEFAEILDAGFSEARVGIIPPGIDQVQVGDIQRSRLNHVKVLFFLGLNDGWVPAREDGGGIVSDLERELLADSGVELAPTARENSYTQRFYLYQNLTKPTDRLYLSWCLSSGDGTKMRPSYLVSVVQKLYPKLVVTPEADAGTDIHQVTTRENGMLYLTKELEQVRNGKVSSAWKELFRQYMQSEEYSERTERLLSAAFPKAVNKQLSYSVSKELYGDVLSGSVTRLEQFAACAFAHFAAYGLRLGPRELYGVKPTDLGILFHRGMERFSRKMQNSGRDWASYTREEETALMEACVDEITAEYGAGILRSSARDAYTINRLKRILSRTAWALHRQICAGTFRPSAIEVAFADAGDLEAVHVYLDSGDQMRLQGRIDRIDTTETDDSIYVKIVDYKSGSKKLDPVTMYYGLQLQLVAYLNAALEMERKLHPGKEAVPAGIFYYHFDDPMLEKDSELSESEQEERLLKKLRPEGILNSEQKVLRMMDQNLGGDSLVIPAGLKRDGALKAATMAVSTEQFGRVSGFVNRKMKEMGSAMMHGEISARPYLDKDTSACDYCAYADVCGFDRKIPALCEYRRAEIDKEKAWERILMEDHETKGE